MTDFTLLHLFHFKSSSRNHPDHKTPAQARSFEPTRLERPSDRLTELRGTSGGRLKLNFKKRPFQFPHESLFCLRANNSLSGPCKWKCDKKYSSVLEGRVITKRRFSQRAGKCAGALFSLTGVCWERIKRLFTGITYRNFAGSLKLQRIWLLI